MADGVLLDPNDGWRCQRPGCPYQCLPHRGPPQNHGYCCQAFHRGEYQNHTIAHTDNCTGRNPPLAISTALPPGPGSPSHGGGAAPLQGDVRTEVTELRREVAEFQEHETELRTEVTELQERKAELTELRLEVAKLRREVAEFQEYKTELCTAVTTLQEGKAYLTQLRLVAATLRRELAEFQEHKAELR